MAGEIELISDGDGVVLIGDRSAVDRFLDHAGLSSNGPEVRLGKLSTILSSAAEVTNMASGVFEQSALYLKLTPESAKRLKDAGGLTKTKTKGVSHAMLGEPGKKSLKWLQVEDGPASLLTNPAVLSGIGGLMSQFAQQAEAQELKALLVRMDEKLDDVRRAQRDAGLAKMNRAAAAIEEAMTIHRHGGDTGTLWAKVSGESATILEVQDGALLALGALVERVAGKSRVGELKKATQAVEREVAIQLAILARCFELQDEFRVVELDHVLATAPDKLEGHRLGLAEARQNRREAVLERTNRLMDEMETAGDIANANVILHARAANSVINSLDSTAAIVDEFHTPIGIAASRDKVSATPWRAALHDAQKLKKAGAEIGEKTVMAGGLAAGLALMTVGVKNLPQGKG